MAMIKMFAREDEDKTKVAKEACRVAKLLAVTVDLVVEKTGSFPISPFYEPEDVQDSMFAYEMGVELA